MNRVITTVTMAVGIPSCAANAQSNLGTMNMNRSMPRMASGNMKGADDCSRMAMGEYMSVIKKMDSAMMAARGSSADATFARRGQGAIEMVRRES